MTNCMEIRNIIESSDKETLKIEFKKSDILQNKDTMKKLLHEIVALANRYGGKILIGINNDGTFERPTIFNADEAKGKISSQIQDSISPILNCEIEYVQCSEGDVIIINVPQKKEMPHAYVKKSNGEIIKREYYIRTSHGIRHVSDRELQFLFKEDKIDFAYPFKVIINYDKKSLRIPLHLKQPPIVTRSYNHFLSNLPKKDIEFLLGNHDKLIEFFLEITPFILICNLSHYFYLSWVIEIKRNELVYSEIPVQANKITSDFLPDLPNDSVLSLLSLDFKKNLIKNIFRDFYIPPNSTLKVKCDKKTKETKLMLENIDFLFEFSFYSYPYAWGAGIETSHPQINLLLETDIQMNQRIYEEFAHVLFSANFAAKFNFPEINFDLFNKYYDYAINLKNILKEDWDYPTFIERMPNFLEYEINYKLDKLINLLKKKKYFSRKIKDF